MDDHEHPRRRPKPTVCRQIFPEENPNSTIANIDNCRNLLIESKMADEERAVRLYNFDVKNEVPLPGAYTYTFDNEKAVYIGVKTNMKCDGDDACFQPETPKVGTQQTVLPAVRKSNRDVDIIANINNVTRQILKD